MTFAPRFLWIFALAPWIGRLGGATRPKGGLAAVAAAVVGVIANPTARGFALHVLFAEIAETNPEAVRLHEAEWTLFDWRAALLAGIGALLIFGLNGSVVRVLTSSAIAGLARFSQLHLFRNFLTK